jgi:hypothetical protein
MDMAEAPVETVPIDWSEDEEPGSDEPLKVQLTAAGRSSPLGYRLVRSFAAPSRPMSSDLLQRRSRYARQRKESRSKQAES